MTFTSGAAAGDGREPAAAGARPPLVSWRVDRADGWTAWTVVAIVGLSVGAALAVFGLPPVDLHTPLHHAGIMDPLCGGTRALRLAAMGQWGQSWTYNPLGIPVLLGFAALAVRSVVGAASGRWYSVRFRWTPRLTTAAVVVATLLLIALEIRQQALAPLLLAH